jgi:hypothetical protein
MERSADANVGRVITVSLETVKIVKNLPPLETEQGKGV